MAAWGEANGNNTNRMPAPLPRFSVSQVPEASSELKVTTVSAPPPGFTPPHPHPGSPRKCQAHRKALDQSWARQARPTRVTLIVEVTVPSLPLSLQEDCIARYKLLVELVQKKKQAKS